MVESKLFQELPSSKGGIDFTLTGDQKLPERELEVAAPDGCLHDESPQETASGEDFLAEKPSVSKNAPTASYAEKGNLDDDSSSMDSFPDIVDVEPDSDAEESG